MTQRFAEKHLGALLSLDEDQNISNWQDWVLAETVRHTDFVVNVINVLSLRMGYQNSLPCRSLDHDLVSKVPLPAPESWWRAKNAENWMHPPVPPNKGITLGEICERICQIRKLTIASQVLSLRLAS